MTLPGHQRSPRPQDVVEQVKEEVRGASAPCLPFPYPHAARWSRPAGPLVPSHSRRGGNTSGEEENHTVLTSSEVARK